MKDILEIIISNLVDNQEEIEITETVNPKEILFEVKVAQDDIGKVIGKQGRTAKSIRILMKSVAAKERKRVSVEFLD